MKKFFQALCLLALSVAYAQNPVSGYYINNNNQKITGEFEYGDYLSPEAVKFHTGTGDFNKLNLADVAEYGVSDSHKLVRYTVDVDATDATHSKFSDNKNPDFEKRTLFLNVLVEGNVVLYSYVDNRNTKYFIKTSADLVPRQLVYRIYAKSATQSAENNEFRMQLIKALNCSTMTNDEVFAATYQKDDLVNLVNKYNKCKGGANFIYTNRAGTRIETFFSAYAGLYATSFDIKNGTPPTEGADKGVGYGIGGEMEIVMPSKKTSFFLRVEYEHLDASIKASRQAGPSSSTKSVYLYDVKSSLFSIFVGPRLYLNRAAKNKLYADVSVSVTISSGNLEAKSYIESTPITTQPELLFSSFLGTALSFNAGLGYSFNNKFAAELRFNTNRDLLNQLPIGNKTLYSRMGVNFRYIL